MTRVKSILAAVVVAAIVGLVPAQAAVNVRFLGSGSSAMFQQFTLAAYNSVCNNGNPGCSHWTAKGGQFLHEQRTSAGTIPDESGTLSVVWGPSVVTSGDTDVWAYLTVDSVVGNRCFFAVPRCLVTVTNGAGQNKVSPTLYDDNSSDQASLPANVFSALNGAATVTAAMTDIRPEDAKFAQARAVTALNTTTYAGLGYGTGATTKIGTQILGAASASGGAATPVCFNITGKDCINTTLSEPASTTIPVGAAPIIFIVNRTAGGVLSASNPLNLNTFAAQRLFSGLDCEASAIDVITNGSSSGPVHVTLREPLSGTMNTTEFTTFRTFAQPKNSQEVGIDPSVSNPVAALPCVKGGGDRTRAIGTGNAVGFVKATTDAIGYTFFSYGNVSSIAGSANYGYLTLNGADPIGGGTLNQQLPTCAGPCALAPNTSFPTLRSGGYQAWSVYRVVTDKTGNNHTFAAALIAAAQATINSKIPDFVPFTAQADGDLGLLVFRSHYTQNGAPHNGINTAAESGGDMGGCIELKADELAIAPAEILNCKQ
jgi:ABC-type phosphate transport system substrate-binding protein